MVVVDKGWEKRALDCYHEERYMAMMVLDRDG